MTHKPPQGIDAGLQEALRQLRMTAKDARYDWSEIMGIKLARLADEIEAAAPSDPRKDLAIPPFGWQLRAVEEALGKLRDAPLAKFLERGYHFNSQDDKNEAMGLGRDLANGIFDAIAQRLAEMRGAKR